MTRSEVAIQETGRKCGAYLNNIAYNILRNISDTEEVVNDTYMATWNAIPPTKPDNFKHFLSRITRNLSFDRLDYLNAGKRHALFVEMDISEVADQYGFSARQVKYLLSKTRGELRSYFEREGVSL